MRRRDAAGVMDPARCRLRLVRTEKRSWRSCRLTHPPLSSDSMHACTRSRLLRWSRGGGPGLSFPAMRAQEFIQKPPGVVDECRARRERLRHRLLGFGVPP